MKRILTSILIVMILTSVPASAELKYRINGRVYDSTKIGVSGVKVDLLYDEKIVKSTKTDKSGKFRLDAELIENQEYTLMLSKNGYQTSMFSFSTPSTNVDEIVLEISLNKLPIVDINGPYEGFPNDVVTFNSEGSYDPEGDTITILWSFGDGGSSSLDNPQHVYAAPGEYQVTLKVIDLEGGEASKTTKCIIDNRPPVSEANGPYSGKAGSPVLFSSEGSYDPDGGSISYEWRFGDGSISGEANPSHTYSSKGDYSVTLIILDEQLAESKQTTKCKITENVEPVAESNGPYASLVGEQIKFSCSGSHDPDGVLTSTEWSFGDGGTSNDPNPTHVYTEEGIYNVELTLSDENGLQSIDRTECTVSKSDPTKPVAEANGPYRGLLGEEIKFYSEGSIDPDGVITSYIWDFGDGSSETLKNPSHVFGADRTYIVSLTVVNEDGNSDIDYAECLVVSRPAQSQVTTPVNYQSPIAEGNGPYYGYSSEPIKFNSSGSYDPDGLITGYTWSFGDGEKSKEANPNHMYSLSGNYTVELSLEDNQGKRGVYTTFSIIETYPPTQASIIAPGHAKEGEMIQFNVTILTRPEESSLTYLWRFGDGEYSEQKNASHRYNVPGPFKISLTVTDDRGKTSSFTTDIVIEENEPPIADLEGPREGRVSDPLTFTAQSSVDHDGEIKRYSIDFGDGTFSNQGTATHSYVKPGTYNVTLIVVDNMGKTGKSSLDCIISEKKKNVVVSEEQHYTAVNEEVQFNPLIVDSEGSVTQVLWDFGDGEISTSRNPTHTYGEEGKYTVTITLLSGKERVAQTTVEVDVQSKKVLKFPLWTTLTLVIISLVYTIHKKYRPLSLL